MPTALEDYDFDLRGYLVLRNVVSPETVRRLNDSFDRFPALDTGEWMGNAQRRDYNAQTEQQVATIRIEGHGPILAHRRLRAHSRQPRRS